MNSSTGGEFVTSCQMSPLQVRVKKKTKKKRRKSKSLAEAIYTKQCHTPRRPKQFISAAVANAGSTSSGWARPCWAAHSCASWWVPWCALSAGDSCSGRWEVAIPHRQRRTRFLPFRALLRCKFAVHLQGGLHGCGDVYDDND